MKVQGLILCFVLFACACQISQKAQTSENLIAENSKPETIVNKVETEKLSLVDDSRFAPVKINRTDRKNKFSLNVNVEYPRLKEAKNAQEKQFNQYVKSLVDEQILDFTNFLIDKEKEVKDKSKPEYEISLDYKIEYVSNDFVSVLLNWHGYSGYLNEDYFPSTVNFDFAKGKTVKLADLFKPKANYLEKLSEFSLEKLKHTCLSCPCKDGIRAGEPLPEGVVNNIEKSGTFDLAEAVSAKEESFNKWSVAAEGLKITFDEYEVGPGCIGIVHIVIPFADLKPVLREDLNFN